MGQKKINKKLHKLLIKGAIKGQKIQHNKTIKNQKKKALDSLICMLDELDNKPRRLFNSLRDVTTAYTKEKNQHYYKIIDSIDEMEEWYYKQIHGGDMIREMLDHKREIERNLCSYKNSEPEDKRNDAFERGYEAGVKDALRDLTKAIINQILDDNL